MILEHKKNLKNSSLNFEVTIEGEDKNIIWNPGEEKIDNGWIIKLNISSEKKPFAVKNVSITAKVPIIDIHGISIPGKVNNPYLFILPWHIEEDTSLYREFPFLSFINRKGENKFALGIKDPTPGFKISGGIIEKTEEFGLDISSITEFTGNSFELEVFISTQQKHWFELSQFYSNWVNPEQDKLPDSMYDPVYCSWYAFYQELDQKYLESVAEEAYNLGFKIFILDDGWFTDDTNRGYWYTGDWKVYEGKFPNFKDHVKKIHDIGMKYVLWIAPFMFGKKSKNYDSLSKYSVNSRDNLGFENLCPQSNFTKKRIINVLKELLIKYDLDGFKLDFIDDLPTRPCSNESHEHFTCNPSKGVKEILESVKKELNIADKPIILEFRQQYANPILKKYSTAFRAADTPFDFDQNRRRIINIRSFSGRFPVYSDPIVWRKGESTENISRHFISCIFSVPMLSIDLLKLSSREKKIIKFWIDFYMENKETLLFGKFIPEFSNGEFVKAYSFLEDKRKLIIALYANNILNLDELQGTIEKTSKLYILNGSNDSELVIIGNLFNNVNLKVEIIDPVKGVKEKFENNFSKFLKLKVEIGNILKIEFLRNTCRKR